MKNNKKKGWTYLIVGGLFETVWATTIFLSEAWTVPLWTVITVVFLFVSVWLLDKGLTYDIPTGVGYSVWVGIGALGAVIMGVFLFDEPVTVARIFFISLILVGVMGLEGSSKEKKAPTVK